MWINFNFDSVNHMYNVLKITGKHRFSLERSDLHKFDKNHSMHYDIHFVRFGPGAKRMPRTISY